MIPVVLSGGDEVAMQKNDGVLEDGGAEIRAGRDGEAGERGLDEWGIGIGVAQENADAAQFDALLGEREDAAGDKEGLLFSVGGGVEVDFGLTEGLGGAGVGLGEMDVYREGETVDKGAFGVGKGEEAVEQEKAEGGKVGGGEAGCDLLEALAAEGEPLRSEAGEYTLVETGEWTIDLRGTDGGEGESLAGLSEVAVEAGAGAKGIELRGAALLEKGGDEGLQLRRGGGGVGEGKRIEKASEGGDGIAAENEPFAGEVVAEVAGEGSGGDQQPDAPIAGLEGLAEGGK